MYNNPPTKLGVYLSITFEGYHFKYNTDDYSGGKWNAHSPYIELDDNNLIVGEWEEEIIEDTIYFDNYELPEDTQLTDEEIETGLISEEKNVKLKKLFYMLCEAEIITLGKDKITLVAYDQFATGAQVAGYLAPHLPEAADHATTPYFGVYIVNQTQLHVQGGGE